MLRLAFLRLVLTAAWAQPAPPQESPGSPGPAAELAELERALAADRQPVVTSGAAPSMNPDISLIADVALAAFSAQQPQQTGAHDPRKNGFHLQQLELSLAKAVDPYFRFASYLVFSQFGVELEEAYATTLALPFNLQARAGQFLTRLGRLNPTHPHAWEFVDQPLALGRLFGGEGNRGLGMELSWLAPLPWYVELLGSLTDAAGGATARSFYGGQDLGVRSPADLQATVAARQFFPFTDALSLSWGLSGAFGPNPTGHGNRTDIFASDVYIRYRPVERASATVVALQAEWFYRRRQIPGDLLQDLDGYAYLSWRFAQRWGTAVRYEHGTPAWDQSGRRRDDLDPTWTDHRHRMSAALTFWPSEFSRLRLQGAIDRPGAGRAPVWALFLAAELLIGAHGAHPF